MGICFNIRMSIIPNPSSRHMKNKIFSIQYSDEIITRSISWGHEEKLCSWARIIRPFSNRFKSLGLSMASLQVFGKIWS